MSAPVFGEFQSVVPIDFILPPAVVLCVVEVEDVSAAGVPECINFTNLFQSESVGWHVPAYRADIFLCRASNGCNTLYIDDALTVIVPVAFTLPHPVKGMV